MKKKRKRRLAGCGIVLALVFSFFLYLGWQGLLGSGPLVRMRQGSSDTFISPFYEARGVVHCHSTLSDGGRSIPEIGRIADGLNLDFLWITDHETLAGLTQEGIYGGCRVLVGTEISTRQGHLLGLGVPETDYRMGGESSQVVGDIRTLGGLSIITHPVNARYFWTAPEWVRPDHIEVLDGDTAWRNASPWKIALGVPAYLINRKRAMLCLMSDPSEALTLWDKYLETGTMYGIAGVDAHERIPFYRWTIPFPRYRDSLSLFQVHVHLDEPLQGPFKKDKKAILEGLRKGRFYSSVGTIGTAAGFSFSAFARENGETAWMGESLTCEGPVDLSAALPPLTDNVRFVLLKNGSPVAEMEGFNLKHAVTDPGVYRIEIYALSSKPFARRIPWIISNPIRINFNGRPLEPPVAPPCGQGIFIENFEGEGTPSFRLEAEPLSLAETGPVQRASPGAAGSEHCISLPFKIPEPPGDEEDLFWALADRTARDLTGAGGISFYIKTDKRLRLKLQVRDEDPQGQEGMEWFSATFMSTPEWSCVTVPFSRLQCVSRGMNSRLDSSRIRGIFLIGDMRVLKPGTSGTVWLDEVHAFPSSEETSR
ncbi:CehA/McbA family metallohydrolase [Acidobacteriota bacterium]